jgi:hypothetical protein
MLFADFLGDNSKKRASARSHPASDSAAANLTTLRD